MINRLLWAIIIIAIIFALAVSFERVNLESNNNQVELIIDYNSLLELQSQNLSLEDILLDLKELGVTQVAIHQRSLGQFAMADKQIDSEIITFWEENPLKQNSLLREDVGFWPEDIVQINKLNLGVVSRLANPPWYQQETWQDIDTSLVIFSGQEVYGYPNELIKTRQAILEHHLRVGSIEFTNQRGFSSVVSPDDVVRVHSITAGEMEKSSEDRIVNRYLRAVRERNIRVLYIRPFIHEGSSWEQTTDLISNIGYRLEKAGFTIGIAEPFPLWGVSLFIQAIIWLGIIAGSWLLVSNWLVISSWAYIIGLVTGWLVVLIGAQINLVLIQQIMALLSAVVFPLLAICYAKGRENILIRYGRVCLVSIVGGLFIIGTLNGTEYLVKLLEFRGVKLMHVMPLILVFVYGTLRDILPLSNHNLLIEKVKSWWNYQFPIKYLFGLSFIALLFSMYLLRTGNFGLPVSETEIAIREGLENLLLARPRTKEFLIGHPALFIALGISKKWSWWLVIAIIGQISMVNTFSHVHTPLIISSLRTIYGIVFGMIIGWSFLKLRSWLSECNCIRLLRVWQFRG